MYLVYVGKECIFKCTLFKSHLDAFLYPQVHVYILASLHLISSGSCVLAFILASSHPHTFGLMCACWHPHIRASSYSKVHVCLFASRHLQILMSWCSCMLACIRASSHPHILRFLYIWLYPHMLLSYSQFVFVYLYPRILTSCPLLSVGSTEYHRFSGDFRRMGVGWFVQVYSVKYDKKSVDANCECSLTLGSYQVNIQWYD